MGSEKDVSGKAVERNTGFDDEAPPSYEAEAGPSSAYAGEPSHTPSLEPQPESPKVSGPTVEAPFNFPSDAALPPYTPAASSLPKPIAIPQTSPVSTAPFLPAYAPVLLSYGITDATWQSFVKTITAFLTAKVSDRAVSHAADVAKHLGGGTTSFFKGLANHAKGVGSGISKSAKKGNVIGAAMGVVGGTISLPIHAAVGGALTVSALPGEAVAALVKKPMKPRQRAEAYIVVANKDWLLARGLQARILDSQQLSELVGESVVRAAEEGLNNAKSESNAVEGQLLGLEKHVAKLEVRGTGASLELGATTLWLVLTHVQAPDDGAPGPSTRQASHVSSKGT